MFSPILLSPLKLKDKYVVTAPYYMDCPNPTEPDIKFTLFLVDSKKYLNVEIRY